MLYDVPIWRYFNDKERTLPCIPKVSGFRISDILVLLVLATIHKYDDTVMYSGVPCWHFVNTREWARLPKTFLESNLLKGKIHARFATIKK